MITLLLGHYSRLSTYLFHQLIPNFATIGVRTVNTHHYCTSVTPSVPRTVVHLCHITHEFIFSYHLYFQVIRF